MSKYKPDLKNPKDLVGVKKVSISKFPATALLHGAHALMNGADKYGPYNWRDTPIFAHIYVDAAKRHLDAWFEGEEVAEDSGCHHLGHALACIAILLDAQEHNCLVDDRPKKNPKVIVDLMERLSQTIQKQRGKDDTASET